MRYRILIIAILYSFTATIVLAQPNPNNLEWMQSIRTDHPLVGQWRIEVSPKMAATHDHFLHIVQVGDETLKSLPKTKTKESDNEVTLSFEYQERSYTLSFDKTKEYGCKIEANKL